MSGMYCLHASEITVFFLTCDECVSVHCFFVKQLLLLQALKLQVSLHFFPCRCKPYFLGFLRDLVVSVFGLDLQS